MSSGGVTGIVVILVLGLAALAVAALLDLRAHRHVNAPPVTGVPEVDAAQPSYVPPHQAERAPGSLPRLTDDLAHPTGASEIVARLADPRCATHQPPPTAVLDGPVVLVCPDGIGSTREVLPTLERVVTAKTALALVASDFPDDLLDVLAANLARGTLLAAPVLADADACAEIAALSTATPVSRADLQSGYLPHSRYGRVATVVVGPVGSHWVSISGSTSSETSDPPEAAGST